MAEISTCPNTQRTPFRRRPTDASGRWGAWMRPLRVAAHSGLRCVLRPRFSNDEQVQGMTAKTRREVGEPTSAVLLQAKPAKHGSIWRGHRRGFAKRPAKQMEGIGWGAMPMRPRAYISEPPTAALRAAAARAHYLLDSATSAVMRDEAGDLAQQFSRLESGPPSRTRRMAEREGMDPPMGAMSLSDRPVWTSGRRTRH